MMTQQQTAQQIWNYLTSKGWSQEAVAATLGNMQSESGIIADRWESDNIGNMSGGYGLVQWTPATKYINWATSNGLVYQDVISQCKRLEWEVVNNQQFYHPSMSFKQFTQSTQSPEVLADIFIRYYERPYNPNQPVRQVQARYWYNLLKNTNPVNPTKRGRENMIIFAENKTAFLWVGNRYTPISSPSELAAIETMMKQAGYDTHMHTDEKQIKYIKKLATQV
ncbi:MULTISPECIES: phage tail tip lysozyme [unclassified Enterococcus]|uniref:phage tail tip lysozyme n=1 Tax=unclassified Enterococcus TaxID=2608891 RepID=UPI00201B35EA|nr:MULTISPECIES: phage tail tip lysozyme [unclassified Enterococcus]